MSCYEYIYSDCYRRFGKANFLLITAYFFYSKTFRWLAIFRMANSRGITKLFGRLLYFFNTTKNQIKIPLGTSIGYGLHIGHGGPIVVNKLTKIGNNCNLSQFTTIGTNSDNGATIGDNVYIGANVCIVENVKIGNNATIGAGSVVTKDIPENATAAGNYAKVLNYNNSGRFIKNKYERRKKYDT